jgi:hypothetical protein
MIASTIAVFAKNYLPAEKLKEQAPAIAGTETRNYDTVGGGHEN